MNKTAMIMGCVGQDSSYLSELLLSKGYRVIGIKRRTSTDTTERIKHLIGNKNFIIEEGDVTDLSNILYLLHKYTPDEIYNLAAQSHVATSFEQPLLTWDVTAKGCLNILEAIRITKFTFLEWGLNTKFYQASSSEMFGSSFTIRGHDGPAYQDESTPMDPQSPYAVAKLAAHKSVQLYRGAYGLHASSGILFNHESERRGENFVTRKITKYVAELFHFKNTLAGLDSKNSFRKLHLGNLDAKRDWGHAEDYVEAMWLMLQQDDGDDYVISMGETHSVRDFLTEAFKVIDINDWSKYVVVDPKFMRPAEVQYLLGDSSKARRKLGWKPKNSFTNLVARMVNADIERVRNG